VEVPEHGEQLQVAVHNRSGGRQTRMASSRDHSRPIRPKRSARMDVHRENRFRHEATISLPTTHAPAMKHASPLPFTSLSASPPTSNGPALASPPLPRTAK